MITFYIGKRKRESSCRKAEMWLKRHQIPYKLVDSQSISSKLIYNMLCLSENGFDDILISKKRGIQKWEEVGLYSTDALNSITTEKLVELILRKPQLLRVPILFDKKALLVGYNEDEIRVFIPHKYRL